MNNILYGKNIDNVAKRSDIQSVTKADAARRLAENPHCLDFRIFDENLIGIKMRKPRHIMNKPFQRH